MPVFDLSPTEVEEWREMTLSGANVSYSRDDPRLQPSPNNTRKSFSESGNCNLTDYNWSVIKQA